MNVRNYKDLSWERTPVEEYDLVRHFVELNNSFPNNVVFIGNDAHGYISYEMLDKKIKELGGNILFKSSLHKNGVRKVYYLLNNNFILLESIYSKSNTSFSELPEELNKGQHVIVSAQSTVLYSGDSVPEDIMKIIDESTIMMASSSPTIGIISRDSNGFFLNEIMLDGHICQDLDLHYGENFNIFHEKLMKRLVEKNKGITLLHGVPGSGKSYYINRLIYDLKEKTDKKIILVPANMVSHLLEPDFNTFLLDLLNDSVYEQEEGEVSESENIVVNGMIFVLEDAESVLMKREDGYSAQATSNILNLTEGLLNNIFKIQIIATYNTSDENIDPAIKRDKRLIAKKLFSELTLEESRKLGLTIGLSEDDIKTPLTVAQIYSLLDKEDDEILIDDKTRKNDTIKAGIKLD